MARKRKTTFLIWKKFKNQDPLEFSLWNHRMGWVGRDLKKPSSSTPTAMGRDLISKLVSISREFFTDSTNMSCRTLEQVLNTQHLMTIFLYTNHNITLLKIKPIEKRLLQKEFWLSIRCPLLMNMQKQLPFRWKEWISALSTWWKNFFFFSF